MQKTTLSVFGAQLLHQFGRVAAFGGSERINVPLCGVAVVGRHKSRLAAHGQADVAADQIAVDRFAQRQHLGPLLFGVRLGYAWRLVNALHAHVVGKLNLGLVHTAFNRGSTRGLRCAGQRYMAFAGHQARGRIQSDPARAGQKHLAPGVQVGEVGLGATRTVEGFDVGFQLNQVARYKACRQAQVSQQLHHQPGGIAAGAYRQSQRFFRRLHARLHSD